MMIRPQPQIRHIIQPMLNRWLLLSLNEEIITSIIIVNLPINQPPLTFLPISNLSPMIPTIILTLNNEVLLLLSIVIMLPTLKLFLIIMCPHDLCPGHHM